MLCAFLIFEAFVVCLFVPAFFLERAMTQREAAHKSLSFPDLNYFRVSGIDKTVKNCASLAPQRPVKLRCEVLSGTSVSNLSSPLDHSHNLR